MEDSEEEEAGSKGRGRGSKGNKGRGAQGRSSRGTRGGAKGGGRGRGRATTKAVAGGHVPGTLPSLGGAGLSDEEVRCGCERSCLASKECE